MNETGGHNGGPFAMTDAVMPRDHPASFATTRPSTGPLVSVVLPTYNERANVAAMIERIETALDGIAWEVIFVDDDSPDGTAALARSLGRIDKRIRCLQRIARRGLAGACIEGMLASQAPYLAVMDADLQHDASLLPRMVARLRDGDADIVIGSRYVAGGASGDGLSRHRQLVSDFSGTLARHFAGVTVSDPMSGFFMIRQDLFEKMAPRLSTQGFKILLDILATGRQVLMSDGNLPRPLRIVELPFSFGARQAGESKLDMRVAMDFVGLLVAKATADRVPPRFVNFVLVGLTGILVHMLMLNLFANTGMAFQDANIGATFAAMTSNFALNNLFTYRDQRLTGWSAVRGLFLFYIICGIGALSNNGVANWLYANQPIWFLAGLCGSIMSAVWNYSISTAFLWGRR